MIAVCVKWVDLRPDIDPVTGAVHDDDRRRGFSAADRAALEVALTLAEAAVDDGVAEEVALLSAAPAAADSALRELGAAGAARLVRVDVADDDDSAAVGAALAATVAALGATLVVCGDYSADRGSGSVPAFLAHRLGAAQALGLVDVDADADGGAAPGSLRAVRRLDGGRREHLRVARPAVVSVEGSVARLRRASLVAVAEAARRDVEVVPPASLSAPAPSHERGAPVPIRPRARVLPAPHGARALDRVVELTGALVERTPPRQVTASPEEAARAIVEQLSAWGYLER